MGKGKRKIVSGEIKKEEVRTGRLDNLKTVSHETILIAEASILGGLLARNNGTIENNAKLARDIVQCHLINLRGLYNE